MGGEEEVLDELLGDGGGAAGEASAGEAVVDDFLDFEPVDAVVVVEAAVFGGDDGVDEVRRDGREWDGLGGALVGRAGGPGGDLALELDCCDEGIDVAEGVEGGTVEAVHGQGEDESAEEEWAQEAADAAHI